jgi:hypothetical protein
MMKSLLIALVLVVAAVAGLGIYQGWFTVAWDRADGKGHITGTLDEDKFQEDKNKALEAVHDLGHQGKDKAASPTEKGKDPAARPVQPPGN